MGRERTISVDRRCFGLDDSCLTSTSSSQKALTCISRRAIEPSPVEKQTLAPTAVLSPHWTLILKGSDGRKFQLSLHEHDAGVRGSPGSHRISREKGPSVRARGRNQIISTRAHWVLVATTLALRRLITFNHDKGASASVLNPTDRSRSGRGGEHFSIPNARLVPHLSEGWK